MAFFCSGIALVEAGGLVALSLQSKTVPYVVAVDNLGRVIASGTADQTSAADEKVRHAALYEWVGDLRMVSSDGMAQRRAIDRVYSRIAAGSQAQTIVSEFYRADPPHKRALTRTVHVEVKAVLATSDHTYEVEWIETTRDPRGQPMGEERWRGAFTVAVNPPNDERLLRMNPLGIYVTHASWARVL